MINFLGIEPIQETDYFSKIATQQCGLLDLIKFSLFSHFNKSYDQ